jgi:hypothetical protein
MLIGATPASLMLGVDAVRFATKHEQQLRVLTALVKSAVKIGIIFAFNRDEL